MRMPVVKKIDSPVDIIADMGAVFIGKDFSDLFKRYRLRSEIETLSEFGDLLAESGFVYETSIFTRWQNGSRKPSDRRTVLAIIKLFAHRGGIRSRYEANSILESLGMGFLTDTELGQIPTLHTSIPFLAPRTITHFTGREELIKELSHNLRTGKNLLLHGSPGVGKTALAIDIAHSLQTSFPDGVLWYQLDSAPPGDILASIAQVFGTNITSIQDLSIRASMVRSLTASKKILFVFDNVSDSYDIDLLMPNTSSCSVLITAMHPQLNTSHVDHTFKVTAFTLQETFALFTQILGRVFVSNNTHEIERLHEAVDGLPLAVHISAKALLNSSLPIIDLIRQITKGTKKLSAYSYHNTNLEYVLHNCYVRLAPLQQRVLVSTCVFKGRDFSLDAIAHMHHLTQDEAHELLELLVQSSLIEYSSDGRYRLHALIRTFLQPMEQKSDIIAAADYYNSFFVHNRQKSTYFNSITRELENILAFLKILPQLQAWQQATSFWNAIGGYLWHTGHFTELVEYGQFMYKESVKNQDIATRIQICVRDFCIFYFWSNAIDLSEKYTKEGLQLATLLEDPFLISISKMRLGRVYIGRKRIEEAETLLHDALQYFTEHNHNEHSMNTYMYLSECSLRSGRIDDAIDFCSKADFHTKRMKTLNARSIYLSIIQNYIGLNQFMKKTIMKL